MHRVVAIITVFFVAIAAGQEPAATCDQLTRLGIADDMIESNRVNTSPPDIDVFSSLWCENETNHAAEGMIYFNVTLARPMVVYGISSRGDCRTSFVKKFTVSYISNQDSRSITEIPMNFTADGSSPVYFFLTPMITDTLKFTIVNVSTDSSGQYCWHLDIFVCNTTTSNSSPTSLLIAGVIILIIGFILISGAVILVIFFVLRFQRRQKTPPDASLTKSILEESVGKTNSENSNNHQHSRDGAKTPDGDYECVPELSRGSSKYDYVHTEPRYLPKNPDSGIRLSANLSYSGIHNVKINEDAPEIEIQTSRNPSYSSRAALTTNADRLQPKPRGRGGKKGSRFKRVLCSWLKRDQPTVPCPEGIKEETIVEESHYI